MIPKNLVAILMALVDEAITDEHGFRDDRVKERLRFLIRKYEARIDELEPNHQVGESIDQMWWEV